MREIPYALSRFHPGQDDTGFPGKSRPGKSRGETLLWIQTRIVAGKTHMLGFLEKKNEEKNNN